jgi:hypothetical protein
MPTMSPTLRTALAVLALLVPAAFAGAGCRGGLATDPGGGTVAPASRGS